MDRGTRRQLYQLGESGDMKHTIECLFIASSSCLRFFEQAAAQGGAKVVGLRSSLHMNVVIVREGGGHVTYRYKVDAEASSIEEEHLGSRKINPSINLHIPESKDPPLPVPPSLISASLSSQVRLSLNRKKRGMG